MANSHATKKPFNPTKAAMAASFPSRTAGASQCSTIASAIGKLLKAEDKRRFMDRMQARASESPPERLPAGLSYARDEPVGSQFAKCEPGNSESANKRAPPAGHFTTVNHPRRAGIPRQLGQTSIVLLCLEFCSDGSVLFGSGAFAVVSIDPGGFCHKGAQYRGEPHVCKWLSGPPSPGGLTIALLGWRSPSYFPTAEPFRELLIIV